MKTVIRSKVDLEKFAKENPLYGMIVTIADRAEYPFVLVTDGKGDAEAVRFRDFDRTLLEVVRGSMPWLWKYNS